MSIISLPLTKLVPSPVNVRKVGGTTIDDLAASIAAHGLIQSLSVRPAEGGTYEVVAGGRRLAALKRLAKEKRLPKGYTVPCRVLDGEDAAEISLAENAVRLAMHPADQFDAFKRLSEQGMPVTDIAARFGVSEETVHKRLRLASVSPRLMDIYRQDGMTLEQLMAFTLSDDHDRQEAAWFEVEQDWQRRAPDIRRRLTQAKLAADDRLVTFVGLEAYLAAGGSLTRDLFATAEESYLDAPDLLRELAAQKLAAVARDVEAEGWAWVQWTAEPFYAYQSGLRTVRAPQRELTEEEQASLEALRTEYELLEELDELSEADEARAEDLAARLFAVEHADRSDWSGVDRTQAGAVVSVDHAGALEVTRGLVPKEETPSGRGAAATPTAKAKPEFSAALLEELSAHRTMAMRAVMAGDPATALDALVWTLAVREFLPEGSEQSVITVQLTPRFPGERRVAESKAAQAFDAIREQWRRVLPAAPQALWDWVRGADVAVKLDLLAFLTASGLNAVQERGSAAAWSSHRVHAALGLDMAEWWQADAAFLGRVSKEQVIDALRSAGQGPQQLAAFAAKKKAVLVASAARALDGTRWLPTPLQAVDASSQPQPEGEAGQEEAA